MTTQEPDTLQLKGADASVEQLQKKEEGDAEEENEEEYPPMELKEYYMPDMLYVFIEKRWGTLSLVTGLIYSVHLFFAIYGVDQYTDISQLRPCKEGQTKEEAAAVYQTAIALAAIFHIIEWLRQLVVLAAALIGSNLSILYYILSLNVVYGFVAMLVAIIMRFSGDGGVCAEVQNDRAMYLSLQIICIILYIFTNMHMHLIMYCLGKDKIHEIVNEPEPDSDEDDGDAVEKED